MVLDLATDRDEDRLVVADEADDVVAWDVGGRDDHDRRPVEVGIEVEIEEAGMRVGRADRRPEPGAREDEVVGVLGGPGQLVGALPAMRGGGAGPADRQFTPLDNEGVRHGSLRGDGWGPGGRSPDRHALRSTLLDRDDSTETRGAAEPER